MSNQNSVTELHPPTRDTEMPNPITLDHVYGATLAMKEQFERMVEGVLGENGELARQRKTFTHEIAGLKKQFQESLELQGDVTKRQISIVRDQVLTALMSIGSDVKVERPFTVLVVDDQKPVVDSICRFLNSVIAGVGKVTAIGVTSGEDALRYLQDPDVMIDVVLSDLNMPGNGAGLVAHVQTDHPGVAVVVMTGYEDGRAASYALSKGAHGFLAKPFTADSVVLAVARAEEFRRMRSNELKARLAAAKG